MRQLCSCATILIDRQLDDAPRPPTVRALEPWFRAGSADEGAQWRGDVMTAHGVPAPEPPQEERPMGQASPTSSDSGTEGRSRRLGGGAIASLTGSGLLVIFMIQNTEDVTLDFLIWSFTWPLWLFTLVTALVGALVWFGLGVMRRHRRRTARRDARRS
jgi:uncharacterized integral membrane protein